MRLQLVLSPENTILRSRTNFFGKNRRDFPPKSIISAPKRVLGIAGQKTKITNRSYLRAQAEWGELLGISKHKTRATMRLELVLGPENTILRSRTNFFGENRRDFSPKSIKSAPKRVLGIAGQKTKITNRSYLRAQAELGELLGISKHKTRATMRLELVLSPENIILRSRTNLFGENRRDFRPKSIKSGPKTSTRNSRSEDQNHNRSYLRAQAELGELPGISKHKTRATMRLELVLGPENTILRSRTNLFGKNRRGFPPKSIKSGPKTSARNSRSDQNHKSLISPNSGGVGRAAECFKT